MPIVNEATSVIYSETNPDNLILNRKEILTQSNTFRRDYHKKNSACNTPVISNIFLDPT
jgi:hypothetical protein